MPVTNISTIHNKMFAICCLEKAERERVKKLWDARFAGDTAFWIEAEPQSNSFGMAQALCEKIQEQGIYSLNGIPCILTIFLDLRQPVSQEFKDELWKVSRVLTTALQCNIQTVLEFGFVGRQGFGSSDIPRSNAKEIVGKNAEMPGVIQHRLCLVGTPALAADGGNSWKAVVVYLDTLRRLINPSDLLPRAGGTANDDIGFLRYGEYNKKEYDRLVKRRSELEDLCGQGGKDRLQDLLNRKRESLKSSVEERFQIRGMLQPQNPDMVVPAGFMGATIKAAKKGKYQPFNAAQQATRSAVMLTAQRLRDEILAAYDAEVKAADETLKNLLEEAKVGLKLRMDTAAISFVLSGDVLRVSPPHNPELAYKEEGYVQEINDYLMQAKAYAISEGARKFNEAIEAAYSRISMDELMQELIEKEAELVKVQNKVNAMGTAEQFCAKYAFHSNPPESDFNPIAATGEGTKYLILRGNTMRAAANASTNGTMIPIYEINELGGGIQVLDDAPVKTIQAVFLNCNDTSLLHLMP